MIAPLIKWDHSIEWDVAAQNKIDIPTERIVIVDVNDKDSEYMKGHVVDGKIWRWHLVEINFIRILL